MIAFSLFSEYNIELPKYSEEYKITSQLPTIAEQLFKLIVLEVI
jgi:hypothetical protein